MKAARCGDGLCGALDCARCHPEYQRAVTCAGCGDEVPLWRMSSETCPECGGGFCDTCAAYGTRCQNCE